MLESFDDRFPKVAESAFVHPSAVIRGDVEIGEYSIVFPGAMVNGDYGSIRIGKCVSIEENCVLHAASLADWIRDERTRLDIGDYVTIGHGAVIHARTIGDRTMIGMNATVLHNVEISDRCVIAAGAVVPETMEIPPRSFVAGVPAEIKGEISPSQAYWVGEGIEGYESYYEDYIRRLRASIALDGQSPHERHSG